MQTRRPATAKAYRGYRGLSGDWRGPDHFTTSFPPPLLLLAEEYNIHSALLSAGLSLVSGLV